MMEKVTILATVPEHIALMKDRLRKEDVAELVAVGLRPGVALWRCYRHSFFSRTAFVGAEPAACWGMSGSPAGRFGRTWLLTTPAVEKVKVAFLREGRLEVAEMLTVCPTLYGYVDASYHKAVRLLEMLGFEVDKPLPFGPSGALFSRYHIERP